jgi:hypothetical protein
VTWLGILSALLTAVGGLIGWLRNRQLIAAGRAEIMADTLQAARDETLAANEARDAVRVSLEREPFKLRDDDGFKRAD